MNPTNSATLLAKISWNDPQTGELRELTLVEGATATIGRLESNDICIKEQHVSRQHARIEYQDGLFMVSDLGSANGVFVNDQRVSEPFPLVAGDEIRLYVPLLVFSALDNSQRRKLPTERVGEVVNGEVTGDRLVINNGPQEGSAIPLLLDVITIGRATNKADWEIALQDGSVSRPHARLEHIDENWVLYDLGSANGTLINGSPINEKGRVLHDGDSIMFGSTSATFYSA